MSHEYKMKYGSTYCTFSLPESVSTEELDMQEVPVLQNPQEAIRKAINHPIASPPLKAILKPGQTVTLLVNDSTRVANSYVFLPILLDECNQAGIPDENIAVLFALGTHRDMDEPEMRSLVGDKVADRVKMYNSTAKKTADFVYAGTTSRGTEVYFHKTAMQSDHIICTGSIVYHFFSGFGGGRKALFPGVSAYETIRQNHSLMLEAGAGLGKTAGNPVYEDQVEGTEFHRPSFLLNVVLNEKKELVGVFAGDYIKAHLEGCEFVKNLYGVPLKQKANLVIATCGGYPKDINVYQMQKTMDNARLAVKEGGIVILLGECREGVGSDMYVEWMKKFKTPTAIEAEVRRQFVIGGHKAYAVTRLMNHVEFILISAMDDELVKTLLFTPAHSMEEALSLAFTKLGNKPHVCLMPQGSLTVPIVE